MRHLETVTHSSFSQKLFVWYRITKTVRFYNYIQFSLGKSDLIDIHCIDQSVIIDNTLVSFIDLSWFLPISSIYIAHCSSFHSKMKTDFMQTVNLLTIELQLRVEGSNSYHFLINSFKKNLKYLIFSSKQGLKSSSGL